MKQEIDSSGKVTHDGNSDLYDLYQGRRIGGRATVTAR